jgi:dinuclear metal center YbgI/SA1388 family protein
MIVRDVERILDQWAPRATAWERDNVGLQIGSLDDKVRKIMVCLDVRDAVVREATKKKVDLVISHHPLLFHPPKAITPDDRVGGIVTDLIQHRIALYALHTNFDFAEGGVSFALAERLGLEQVTFLEPRSDFLRKIAVFVPPGYVEKVTEAMGDAGAGIIGKYDHCSFRIDGVGTFRGGEGTRPFVGRTGELERVNEVRLEMVVPRWKVHEAVAAMRAAHPYEEVAYDVYVTEDKSANHGEGAIGVVSERTTMKKFVQRVKERLDTPMLRCVGDLRASVERIAVCGGSGSYLVDAAVRRGADVMVTADVTYHTFEAAAGRIALIDAGHFETEQPSLDKLARHLQSQIGKKKERVDVIKTEFNTNPVLYV